MPWFRSENKGQTAQWSRPGFQDLGPSSAARRVSARYRPPIRRGGRALSWPRNNKRDDDDRRDDRVNAVGADGQAKEIDE